MALNVGGRSCELGFDWSYYQPVRNLAPAVAEGHRFAVIKATEGDSYRDPKYGQHVSSATLAGLIVGAYHFARPDWSDGGPYQDGRQEARLFLSVIDARIQFCVLDLEATVLDAYRTTDYVNGWWDEIKDSGQFPLREQRVTYVGKYFNWAHAVSVRDASVLWIPSYTVGYAPDPNPSAIPLPAWSSDLWDEGWALWQYTSSGTVAGTHPSDMNVATTAWVESIRTGTSQNSDQFARQEDDMPRSVYKFPDGSDNPNAKYPCITLEYGTYEQPEGRAHGYYWAHQDGIEFMVGVSRGLIEPAKTYTFSTGDDDLDRLYENLPHVYPGDKYASAPATPAPAPAPAAVDVPALVKQVAAGLQVVTTISPK